MNLTATLDPELFVAAAVEAAKVGEPTLVEVLDQIPAAVYLTDRNGTVTHFNRACIALAGRQPAAHQDQWCVTWKLYTEDGTFLPHDRCPMATAIREQRKIRGVRAIAERPDGTRVRFMPFPTPLLDDEQELVGAVNLLVDLADPNYHRFLRAQAARCRRLAAGVDYQVSVTLLTMAAEYEQQVRDAALN